MNERFACWVIVSGSTQTAFRSKDKEDLLPTFAQLRRKDPSVQLKFFARGKLWDSPEQALEALRRARTTKRPHGRDWRPGGEHRDPRARYELSRDEKRARFKRRTFAKRAKPNGPKRG